MTKQGPDTKGSAITLEGGFASSSKKGETDNFNMSMNSTAIDDAPVAILDERIQAQIGQQLSSFYKELVNQPIPQNFIDLLAKLDRQEGGK